MCQVSNWRRTTRDKIAMNRLARTNHIDRSDASKSKLFGLFALNRQIRLESSPRINDANNQSLQLDWDAFCYDIFKKPSEHSSTWQRLSQQILSLHRSRSIIVPSRSKQHFQVVLDAVRIDSKFERSFNVAMFLTARALRIKGVSDDNIARTQSTLQEKQSQQTKDRQLARATQAVKSRTCRPSVKHHYFDSLSAPAILAPITRSVSLSSSVQYRRSSRCKFRPPSIERAGFAHITPTPLQLTSDALALAHKYF